MRFTQNQIDRFWSKVRKTEACWEWTGYISRYGYGVVAMYKPGGRGERRKWLAHRVSHLLVKGEIPKGYEVHHVCENTRCVRPDHLMAVTPMEHHRDLSPTNIAYINFRKRSCNRGHPFNAENTYWRRTSKGSLTGRDCRECHKIYKRRSYYRVRGRELPATYQTG